MRALNNWNKFLLYTGVILIILGFILLFSFSSLLAYLINISLTLSDGSETFQEWRLTKHHIPMDIYFFNWTNPDDINKPDIKPKFEEVGPYRLKHTREKVNITFNLHNDTVTYKHFLNYYFDEDSPGNISDTITTIDMISLSLAHRTKDELFYIKDPAKIALMFSSIHVTKTVEEMISGYTHTLVTAANMLNFITGENAPDKFGWFYVNNQSVGFDGVFNVRTKAGDDFGSIKNWNYDNVLPMYEGECGELKGSAGEFYPQHLKPDHITYFSADLCRPLEFTFEEELVVKGIPSYKYSAKDATFDNGSIIDKNKCYCSERCFPSGVLDNSKCRNGIPVFSSLPHFYYADESYITKIEGMNPQKDKHEFYFTFEPGVGVITSTAARLQVNVLLQPLPDYTLYKNVPEIMFPVFWTENKVDLYDEHASRIRLLLMSPTINKIFSIVLIGVGCLSISYVALLIYCNEKRVTKSKVSKTDISLK